MLTTLNIRFGLAQLNIVSVCWAAGLLLYLALTGCATLTKVPTQDPLALQLVEDLKQTNRNLKQFKALAQVRFELERVLQSVHSMAMAAELPGRMRVEVLSTVGQPLTSLVADGTTLHIRPHGKKRIYHLHQSATVMEHLIHIPMGVEQLQGALIGRPELDGETYAQLVKQTGSRVTVALKNRWRDLQALLIFDTDNGSIQSIERFGEQGESLYRVNWIQWRQEGQYQVPRKLLVETDAGEQVTVNIRRFWPDVALSPGTFVLKDAHQIP